MRYINAADVLPKKLLIEILNYVDGERIVVQENIMTNVIMK